ncbi:MAG: hypothetical protein LBM60_07615 [Clostridium sp.]|jgi:hypothetical protein|nr:hypothetical protein [Clostridium sp.]
MGTLPFEYLPGIFMIIKNNIEELLAESKRIVLIGELSEIDFLLSNTEEFGLSAKVYAILKWPETIGERSWTFKKRPISSISMTDCVNMADKIVFVIATHHDEEAFRLLQSISAFACCDCYYFFDLRETIPNYCLPERRDDAKLLNQKKLHCIWIGTSPMPRRLKKYIEHWRNLCPDYEIHVWNDDTYDIAAHPYVKSCYDHNAFSFASDYIRLDVLYRYGGIYLDADVELLKRPDYLLYDSAFFAFETKRYINTGLGCGAAKGHPMIAKLMQSYDNRVFRSKEELELCVDVQTPLFQRMGLRLDNTLQEIDGVKFYPSDVFNPVGFWKTLPVLTPNTFSVHHYESSGYGSYRAMLNSMSVKAEALARSKPWQ